MTFEDWYFKNESVLDFEYKVAERAWNAARRQTIDECVEQIRAEVDGPWHSDEIIDCLSELKEKTSE
jgi:hypothetical protein